MGEKEWYFYCPRDRKYRNSTRPNRVTGGGFWKATGTDRPIYSLDSTRRIGLKKSLVFYRGRAAKGVKTDWMMHEFRLPSLSDSHHSTYPNYNNKKQHLNNNSKEIPSSVSNWICPDLLYKNTNYQTRTESSINHFGTNSVFNHIHPYFQIKIKFGSGSFRSDWICLVHSD